MKIVLPALRYFSVLAIVSLLVLTALAVGLNLNASRPAYEWVASRALDREVQIAGPITLRFGAPITLSMSGITIAGTTPDTPVFATIGSAVAELAPMPLLDSAIILSGVSVADISVYVDIDETGRGNWPAADSKSSIAEEANGGAIDYQLRIADLAIEGARLTLHDARSNRDSILFIDSLQETLVNEDFQLSSQGTLNNYPFATTLMLDGVQSLLDIRNWGVDWQGTLGDADFRLNTAIASPEHLIRSDVDLALRANSMAAVLQALALPPIDDGPAEVLLRTRQQNDRQVIELDAALGKLRIVGTADHALEPAWESVHLAVRANGPSLAEVGALLDMPGLPTTPFTLDLRALVEGSGIEVETLQLTNEAINLSLAGALPAYRSFETGTLSGNIDIPNLNSFSGVLDLPRQLQGSLNGTLLLTRDADGTDVLITSQSPMLTLELSGRLTPETTLAGSTTRFSGSSTRPDQWLGLFLDNPPTVNVIEFAGEATVVTPETLAFEDLVVNLDNDVMTLGGIVGWGAARHQTAISLTAQSPNMRATLTPWVPSPDTIPELPASASAQINYPAADSIQIEKAHVSAAESEFQFNGGISLIDDAYTVSGLWEVSVPSLTPFFPEEGLTPRYQRPLSFTGNVEWEPGAIAIDIGDKGIKYGSITAEGNVSVDLTHREGHFNLLASTPDARDYLPLDEGRVDHAKMPMKLRAVGGWTEATLRAEALRVDSADIQIAAAGLLELTSANFTQSHFDADINISRLTALGDWIDFPFPDQGLTLTANLDSRDGALVINTLALRSGDSDLALEGALERGSNTQLQLHVSSDRLNLDPWIEAIRGRDKADGEHDPPPGSDERILPDYPVSTQWLSQFSADIELKIAELLGAPRPVFNVQGSLAMGSEGVRIESLTAENERAGGATLRGALLATEGAAPQLDVRIEGFDLVMGIPKAPSEAIDSLPAYEFKSKFSGSGATTRELASSLDGYLNVVMGSGKVLNAGFDRLTNSFLLELSQVLNPLQDQRTNTTINCAAAFVTLESGELWGKPAIVLDTPDVKILSNITLDLGTERIKAKFKTVPQKGLGFSVSSVFNPYVEVSGTLAAPKIMVDPASTVVGGSLAVVTGGLSILAQNVIDRMNTSGNVCAERLSKANDEMLLQDSGN